MVCIAYIHGVFVCVSVLVLVCVLQVLEKDGEEEEWQMVMGED